MFVTPPLRVFRFAVVEAFAALLDLAPDSTWDRLVRDAAPGSLLAALSGGLGPSHRASVALLGQMPRSSRGTQLRQLGALQLLSKLIPGAKQQVKVVECCRLAVHACDKQFTPCMLQLVSAAGAGLPLRGHHTDIVTVGVVLAWHCL
jgi:hypothetical protein